eukprot:3608404-Amphidinium_carterae.1
MHRGCWTASEGCGWRSVHGAHPEKMLSQVEVNQREQGPEIVVLTKRLPSGCSGYNLYFQTFD